MNKSVIIIMLAAFFLVPGIAAADFTDHGNGTVTDTSTNLMWQKQDDATPRDWGTAISYCEGLTLGSFTDWRLPNVKELRSIVDSSKTAPMINSIFSPFSQGGYWSSTSYTPNATYAWSVEFGAGRVLGMLKTSGYYVRCVR